MKNPSRREWVSVLNWELLEYCAMLKKARLDKDWKTVALLGDEFRDFGRELKRAAKSKLEVSK